MAAACVETYASASPTSSRPPRSAATAGKSRLQACQTLKRSVPPCCAGSVNCRAQRHTGRAQQCQGCLCRFFPARPRSGTSSPPQTAGTAALSFASDYYVRTQAWPARSRSFCARCGAFLLWSDDTGKVTRLPWVCLPFQLLTRACLCCRRAPAASTSQLWHLTSLAGRLPASTSFAAARLRGSSWQIGCPPVRLTQTHASASSMAAFV